MKFTMSGSQQDNVTFRAEIDGDGDLMVFANGCRLLFITNRSGELYRVVASNCTRKLLPGLKFDTDGRIMSPV